MFLRLKWKARDQRDGEGGSITHAFVLVFVRGDKSELPLGVGDDELEVTCTLQEYREAKPGDVWELRRVGDHS